MKVEVDLLDPKGGFVPEKLLEAVTSGCQRAVKRPWKLGRLLDVFRVTFVFYGLEPVPGPRFQIHFHDTIGRDWMHTFEYRLVGKWKEFPTSEEITDAIFESELRRVITEHLVRSAFKIGEAQTELEELLPDKEI